MNEFRAMGIRAIADISSKLIDDGVDISVVAEIAAIALGRMNRPSYAELARQMFVVEKLPDVALPFYCGDISACVLDSLNGDENAGIEEDSNDSGEESG